MQCLPKDEAQLLQQALCELRHILIVPPSSLTDGHAAEQPSHQEEDKDEQQHQQHQHQHQHQHLHQHQQPMPPKKPTLNPNPCWDSLLSCEPHPEDLLVTITVAKSDGFPPRQGAPSKLNIFIRDLSPSAHYYYSVYITCAATGALVYQV